MIWLVILGFVLGIVIAVPLTSFFWAFAFNLTVVRGKMFTMVGDKPGWTDRHVKK